MDVQSAAVSAMMGFAGATVAFRTDASLQIGTGHVMRSLTLATALKAHGAKCCFVCRSHSGHLMERIQRQGHEVVALPTAPQAFEPVSDQPAHRNWLSCDWPTDAQQTLTALEEQQPDWLVVDHYALDAGWEIALRGHVARLMVIDDLADRPHCCDLLLDQNLGRQSSDYVGRVSPGCRVLIGPRFALLRPEFAALREYSLRRRTESVLNCLLIVMGGVDRTNATGQVLRALRTCELPQKCRIHVVLGPVSPWIDNVRDLAAQMPWPTEVSVDAADMARYMADSDLAIGAAGGTAWERCCLGLPTLMVVMADNQRPGALALESVGAAVQLGELNSVSQRLPVVLGRMLERTQMSKVATAASQVTDGRGVERVLAAMVDPNV